MAKRWLAAASLVMPAFCSGGFAQEMPARPLKVKVVVVTMYEPATDAGGVPGEFTFWAAREKLTHRYPAPAAFHDIMANDAGVVGIVTGVGTAHSASTVMAVGTDARFDFSEAYWLVAGIAGVDPADASLGSAAWAEWVVDGDLAHEIDAREMPKEWKTPFVPLQSSSPYPKPRTQTMEGCTVMYHLNAGLRDWAYELTRDTPLLENEKMKTSRARYTETPAAQRPPFVLKGDTLSSSTFWHGKLMDEHRDDAVADQPGEGRPGGPAPGAGPADGEQLRPPAARTDRGGEPRRGKRTPLFRVRSQPGSRLPGGQRGRPRTHRPLGQVRGRRAGRTAVTSVYRRINNAAR